MIHGHKPGGYFVTADGEGHKIEGESRQCIHCQFVWEYKPGSGDIRGFCTQCNGFLCGRPACFAEQQKLIEYMRERFNQTRSCVPFEEWHDRLRDKFGHKFPLDPGLTVTESGLIVPVTAV